jgi:hypothetical protein
MINSSRLVNAMRRATQRVRLASICSVLVLGFVVGSQACAADHAITDAAVAGLNSPQQLAARVRATERRVRVEKARTGRATKFISPLLDGVDDLLSPTGFFRSTHSRFWSATRLRFIEPWGENTLRELASKFAAQDMSFGVIRPYSLTTPEHMIMSAPAAIRKDDQQSNFALGRASPLVRNSAAQLHVRMSEGLSLMWEVDRSQSVVEGSEVGVGLGFKVAF